MAKSKSDTRLPKDLPFKQAQHRVALDGMMPRDSGKTWNNVLRQIVTLYNSGHREGSTSTEILDERDARELYKMGLDYSPSIDEEDIGCASDIMRKKQAQSTLPRGLRDIIDKRHNRGNPNQNDNESIEVLQKKSSETGKEKLPGLENKLETDDNVTENNLSSPTSQEKQKSQSGITLSGIAKLYGYSGVDGLSKRAQKKYLHDNLKGYNNFFIEGFEKKHNSEKPYHNQLLVQAYSGFLNVNQNLPKNIGDFFNLDEICLLMAGVYKEKEYYPKGNRDTEEIRNSDFRDFMKSFQKSVHNGDDTEDKVLACDQSWLAYNGVLEKRFYDIVSHLLNTNEEAFEEYKSRFKSPNKEFSRANPYSPDTLKDRCEILEKHFTKSVDEFKAELARPFIPIEYTENKRYAQRYTEEVTYNKGGYHAPGKKTPTLPETIDPFSTRFWGMLGEKDPVTVWRIDEYAKEFADGLKKCK